MLTPQLNRRALVGTVGAVGSILASAFGSKVWAKLPKDSDIEPRGSIGRFERLGSQSLEGTQDFLTNFRGWVNASLSRAANVRAQEIFKANGHSPTAELPMAEIIRLLENDPTLSASARTWISTQQMMWKTLQDHFHDNGDQYLAEMEVADKSGPGMVELNPGMHIPDYTKHEIHIQPGGYVGDPFAGHIYLYGTANFFVGRNYQDEIQAEYAESLPLPADGKVKRVLDQGCSCGQTAVQIKGRFPDADVWGIDVGGPMVRFAHMRAVDIGANVNFAQRLAEDSKFHDNHFDIVTNNIIFHEVPPHKAQEILNESFRVLRPGGVYYPIDFYTGSPAPKTAYGMYRQWWDHRWNNEVYRLDYAALDFAGAMKKAGFIVNENGPAPGGRGKRNIMGTKPA
ncbi:MAG: class I SAM-dependent methyltransferase [Alphaproteobacteria bacterium]|nr:class I SAM-dependent methyltransferase [Alphaproteobacteria bacterium]